MFLFYTRNLPLRCVSARKLVIHGACFLLATRGIRFLIISLVSKVLEVAVGPVVVEGRFTVLTNDPYGLFYRMVDAVPVK